MLRSVEAASVPAEATVLEPCRHDRAAARRALQRRVDTQLARPGPQHEQGGADGHARGGAPPTALTARQREIVVLIAAGRTNREIAELLVLSEGTVTNHVERILRRLRFRNRVQVATWAVEVGLALSPSS